MKGLQRLVNLRGGLMQHNINPHTRRLVLWYDSFYAMMVSTKFTTGPISTVRMP